MASPTSPAPHLSTTARPGRARSPRSAAGRVFAWHPALATLTAVCLLLFVVSAVGIVTDPRMLAGVPIWDKPAKFALSIAIYAFTLAWLIHLMPTWRRAGSVIGTVSAAMLSGELMLIVMQVVRGRTSHFDDATSFDAWVYQLMAIMIGTLWVSNAVLVVLLLAQRLLPDRPLTWALRLGMLIAVLGMALAFLMTLPTPAQRASDDAGVAVTVVGAHTVGLPDGGPGIPLLGWSTVGGDLRIPHFVGLHGLQVMILLALALTTLGRRYPTLADETVRLRIVFITAIAYTGLLAILTWQALRGQSVVHPDTITLSALATLVVAALSACALAVRSRPHPLPSAGD